MANDRKPEPEAGSRFGVAGVCLSKTIEDVRQEICGDADPGIRDLNHDLMVV